MKTDETKNTTVVAATETKTRSIQDIVNEAMTKNPEGGSITLDSLEKQFKDLSRHELVEMARGIKGGAKLCVGRKGQKSRLVWGKEIPAHLTNSPKRPYVRRISEKTLPTPTPGAQFNYQFKITVGEEIKTVPIKLELQAA